MCFVLGSLLHLSLTVCQAVELVNPHVFAVGVTESLIE